MRLLAPPSTQTRLLRLPHPFPDFGKGWDFDFVWRSGNLAPEQSPRAAQCLLCKLSGYSCAEIKSQASPKLNSLSIRLYAFIINITMPKEIPKTTKNGEFLFGTDFLRDHVGQIIDDPSIAILELVANCYDAGADKVEVSWPNLYGDALSITDNGSGMTRKEFETRWRTLKYDRVGEQGTEVVFPSSVHAKKRTAFGHNG
ncbi:MAG TPA: ATP-binding protein, partial [Terriglobales bacterium]